MVQIIINIHIMIIMMIMMVMVIIVIMTVMMIMMIMVSMMSMMMGTVGRDHNCNNLTLAHLIIKTMMIMITVKAKVLE